MYDKPSGEGYLQTFAVFHAGPFVSRLKSSSTPGTRRLGEHEKVESIPPAHSLVPVSYRRRASPIVRTIMLSKPQPFSIWHPLSSSG
jgi:hypothetical protein